MKKYIKFLDDRGDLISDIRISIKTSFSNLDNSESISEKDIKTIYESLDLIVRGVVDSREYEILRSLARMQPTYYFGTLFYILKSFDYSNKFIEQFNNLENYLNYEISFFYFVNYLYEVK